MFGDIHSLPQLINMFSDVPQVCGFAHGHILYPLSMPDAVKMWQTALIEIETTVSQANFSTWFKETAILKEEDGIIYLRVPNSFTREWLQKKFHNSILRILRQMNDKVRALEYVIAKDNAAKGNREQAVAPTIAMPLQDFYVDRENNLNPRYTFESFVIGPFNELAHAASQTVVKSPGTVYNPLFVYGDTGRGKTHLIQAVGNRIKELYPGKRIYYMTSERFGSELLTAFQESKANQFKDRYRKYDVLILDDVQFFAGKDKFQEEFFHLFNMYKDTGRQLVFSSDKHPNIIGNLEERLRSRFNGGMVVDISEPDTESLTVIARTKCSSYGMTLSNEAVECLVHAVKDNIREVEGVVNVIACQTQLKSRELSITEIKAILKSSAKPKKTVAVKEVVKAVCDFYGVEEENIYDKSRRKEVVRPRQVVMYLLREDFNVSFPSIGDKLGGRDHTTVIHSYNKVKSDLKTDSVLSQEIGQLRSMF